MGFPPSRPKPMDRLYKSYMGNYIITKVTFSSDITSPNCLTMVFFKRVQGIFFCRLGDCRWIEVVLRPMPNGEPVDAAYYNGSFYLLDRNKISIYDLSRHKVLGLYLFDLELCYEYKFFVVCKSALYIVVVHFSKEGDEEEPHDGVERVPNKRVVMYKVINTEDPMEVERINDANDITIFYGQNYHYLGVDADGWDSLNGASMYIEYMCSALTCYGNYKNGDCYNIMFARLNDGKSQPVANGIGEVPNVFPHPPVMWFQPSFV